MGSDDYPSWWPSDFDPRSLQLPYLDLPDHGWSAELRGLVTASFEDDRNWTRLVVHDMTCEQAANELIRCAHLIRVLLHETWRRDLETAVLGDEDKAERMPPYAWRAISVHLSETPPGMLGEEDEQE